MPETSDNEVRPVDSIPGDGSIPGSSSIIGSSSIVGSATIPGASRMPPAPPEVLEAIFSATERLRTEAKQTDDAPRRARLLYEVGEIEERGGDEQGAARDYLKAFNADPQFREPLEGLVRLLERRRSVSNIGKLVEALVATAETSEERTRAQVEHAMFLADVQGDWEGARAAAREGTEIEATDEEAASAWLWLELAAARLGDAEAREEALRGRGALANDPTWGALLEIDVAELAFRRGDVDGALEVFARRMREDAPWAFAVARRLVRGLTVGFAGRAAPPASRPGNELSEPDVGRRAMLAEAFEIQANAVRARLEQAGPGDLAASAPSPLAATKTGEDDVDDAFADDSLEDELEDADLVEEASEAETVAVAVAPAATVELSPLASGVPAHAATAPNAAYLLYVAAELRRSLGDASRAARCLDEALELVANDDGATLWARPLLVLRMRLAERSDDTGRAAEIAQVLLETESDGRVAAGLAMRMAEDAASQGDAARALSALATATGRDPSSVPARALKLDILEGGPAAPFVSELLATAERLPTREARARFALLAAWTLAVRDKNTIEAQRSLVEAEREGLPALLVARLARVMARVSGDAVWLDEATTHEQSLVKSPEDVLALAFDRVRGALDDGTPGTERLAKALDGLSVSPTGRLLAALLRTYLPRAGSAETVPAGDVPMVFGPMLTAIGALRALDRGKLEEALAGFSELAESSPEDIGLASLVADFALDLGDLPRARAVLERAASHVSEPAVSAALLLQSTLLAVRAGQTAEAIAALELADDADAVSANATRAWLAAALGDTPAAAITAATTAGDTSAATVLERAFHEHAAGDLDAAAVTFASATDEPLAAALGVLLTAPATSERADALAVLRESGARELQIADALAATWAAASSPTLGGTAEALREWAGADPGPAQALAWFGAAAVTDDIVDECEARTTLAERIEDPELAESLRVGAALLAGAHADADERLAIVQALTGELPATRLARVELSPPGRAPAVRARALANLGDAVDGASELSARVLSAWNVLALGDAATAKEAFATLSEQAPESLAVWEGLRSAAEAGDDRATVALACEQLGARCTDDARAALFWELAGLTWLEVGAEEARAEHALGACVERDPGRTLAFDTLFRRVRDRKEGDRLLELVEARLPVAETAAETAKLFWEQARVLREKGDPDGALIALEQVTQIEPSHVGALALAGEIYIRKGRFEDAALHLAELSRVAAAPPRNRVTAGIAAVDLYENKLGQPEFALALLIELHEAGLSTLPVRERLAKTAAKLQEWPKALEILEGLMVERPEPEGRVEAARLAMAIRRDRLRQPSTALPAVERLLEESPGDGEALDLVLSTELPKERRLPLLLRGRDTLQLELSTLGPPDVASAATDLVRVERLAALARATGEGALEHAAVSVAIALDGPNGEREGSIAQLALHKSRVPLVALPNEQRPALAAPGDEGPIARLFVELGPTLAEALGPNVVALGVGKRERVDPRAGNPVRNEIAAWAGALGLPNFDFYVGGRDPHGVTAVPGDPLAIVVGHEVTSPLGPYARARLGRALLGAIRGSFATWTRDDMTVAAVVVAACNLCKVPIDSPHYAVLAEVERLLGKAIARRTKAAIEPICREIVRQRADAGFWAERARASALRAALLCAGDAAIVVAELFGEGIERVGLRAREDERARELFAYALSPTYLNLRRSLRLEGNG